MQLVKFNSMWYEIEHLNNMIGKDLTRFSNKTIYITGASGFIGWWIWRTLMWATDQRNMGVRTDIRRSWKDNDGEYHHIPGEYDYVFHCAPTDYPFKEVKAKEAILFASSGAAKLLSTNYATMKQDQEEELTRLSDNARIARIYTLVGPHQRNYFAVTHFIRSALSGEPLQVFGDGSAIRSYMYIADCAWWLLKIALDGVPGGVYDVGATEPVTIKELAYKVAGMVDPPGVVEFVKPDFVDHAPKYLPDTEKTEKLGVKIVTPVDVAIQRTINFYQENGRLL